MSDDTTTECFIYRLKPGAGPRYDELHADVWPEIIASIHSIGIQSYAIYRRGDLVISILTRVTDHVRPDDWGLDRDDEWAELVDPLFAEYVDERGEPLFAEKVFDLADYTD